MKGRIKELQDPRLRAHYFAFVFKNTHGNARSLFIFTILKIIMLLVCKSKISKNPHYMERKKIAVICFIS